MYTRCLVKLAAAVGGAFYINWSLARPAINDIVWRSDRNFRILGPPAYFNNEDLAISLVAILKYLNWIIIQHDQ
jgi:hypothetical protein